MSELFVGKSARFTRKRCGRCRIPFPHCICNHIPQIDLKVKLWILTHQEETLKPTNTGQLILNACTGSKKIVWDRVNPNPSLLKVSEERDKTLILYPGEGSELLEHYQQDLEPYTSHNIILLDGTWKQAGKMYNHSPYLKDVPKIRLNSKTHSSFQLRNQKKPHHLSTVEAAIEILRELGEMDAGKKLKDYFSLFQYYYQETKKNKMTIPYPSEEELKEILT